MALPILGTAAVTASAATASSLAVNMPADIQAGDVLFVVAKGNDIGRQLGLSGWQSNLSVVDVGADVFALTFLWKIAVGDEGATVTFNEPESQTANFSAVAMRLNPALVDASTIADLVVQVVGGEEGDEDPFTLAANAMTGVTSGNHIGLAWGADATRTITTIDTGYTLAGSTTGGAVGNSLHVASETSPGTANAAASHDMSGSRGWGWALFEIKAAAPAGLPIPVAAYHYNHRLRNA